MKKIVTAVMVMSVLSMSLYGYSKEERVKDMQTMEMAMAKIQKGILSNDDKMVIEGVDNLKKSSANVEVAPKWKMDYSPSYAKQQTKNIMKYADKIKSSIESDRKHSANSSYTKVLGECISCHNKLRTWK
jgi:cytochrome c556